MASQDLTLKQRKWLQVYLETGNATEAAVQAYDVKDREGAAQIGWENLRKLDYTEFLEEAGITDNLLQKKIFAGLEATKTVSAKITTKDADSQTDDFIDVPDFLARHKYLETALKLKQRLLTKFDITSGGNPIAILGGATKDVPTNNSNPEVTTTK